jgi:hypothetical protein
MAQIIQMIDPQTIKMSIAASGKLRTANWSGVKARLAIKLTKNGNAARPGNLSRYHRTNTKPNVTAITG